MSVICPGMMKEPCGALTVVCDYVDRLLCIPPSSSIHFLLLLLLIIIVIIIIIIIIYYNNYYYTTTSTYLLLLLLFYYYIIYFFLADVAHGGLPGLHIPPRGRYRSWGQFLDEGQDSTLKDNQHGPRSQKKAAPAAHHSKELADKKEVSPPKPKG